MGRSSYGKSSSFHPGTGHPLAGRRFAYDEVPVWDGLFGETVVGEYGVRMREDPSYRSQINQAIFNIRSAAREQIRNIRDTSELMRSNNRYMQRQDYLEAYWIQAETELQHFREQYVLYKNTPLEPVFNQAIKSELYKMHNIEKLYDS